MVRNGLWIKTYFIDSALVVQLSTGICEERCRMLFRNSENALSHFDETASVPFENPLRVFDQGQQHHAQLLHFAQLASGTRWLGSSLD
jgi:hypothetical protein